MKNQKIDYKLVAEFLKRRVQKKDIENFFHVSERKARQIVENFAKENAVISYPSKPGYKAADDDDLEELIITRNYLRSVIKELENRLIPVENKIKEIALKDIRENPSTLSKKEVS